MIKRITIYCSSVLLLAVVMMSCSSDAPNLPSLHQTFSKDDVLPFGGKVSYQLLRQYYVNNYLEDQTEDFSTNWKSIYNNTADTESLYICISKNLYTSSDDVGSMLDFASYGNTLFIASANFSSQLLDTLGCNVYNMSSYYSFNQEYELASLKNTYLQMSPALSTDSSCFGYFFLPLNSSFSKHDSITTRVLGLNANGYPNFIVIFYGKGRIYLHCAPEAFSNYFLLQNDNYKYLQNVLSFTPPAFQHIYWDDYYNKHNYAKTSGSGFAVLLQYPPLKWAFWLSIILLLMYIIFGGKRRQRIIPVLTPMKNTTVAYTETISRLYLQKKDNRNIADKMITYFFEYIRNQFFLNTNVINADFVDTVSRKSSVPLEKVTALFNTITHIQHATAISDQELLLLNQQIEQFFKNRQ